MYLCILGHEGEILLHMDINSRPQAFLDAIEPYRNNLVAAAEYAFTWYRDGPKCVLAFRVS